ncbi:MAG TPA: hypothetical protein VFO38_06255, partial [Candidatus Saccharimonadales bacterium]|nr:hypothetical protein [Candidatus Saccharimonadales bacterium]
VKAKGKVAEQPQQVFAPRFEFAYLSSHQPLLVNLGAAADGKNFLSCERLQFFFEQNERGAFGHKGFNLLSTKATPLWKSFVADVANFFSNLAKRNHGTQ